ncbi:MAG: hypothetical protein JWN41_807, partial [Thermoleophilia bacterium]|nr:hypothetical protein [Thermoleophilia bacterium]
MNQGRINVRPLSGLVGIIIGWVVAAAVLTAFRLWSGGLEWHNGSSVAKHAL